MGTLINLHWRLAKTPILAWTLAAMAFVALQRGPADTGEGFTFFFFLVEASPILAMLAAALTSRLFSADLMGPRGAYLKLLPVAPAKVFCTKIALSFFGVVLSAAILWTAFSIGLLGWLIPGLLGGEAVVPPTYSHWCNSLAMSLLVCSAAAWFSTSFDRPLASRQAGWPAFFAGGLCAKWLETYLNPYGPAVFFAAMFLVSGLLIFAAWRQYNRRGVMAGHESEFTLVGPQFRDWPVLLFAQALLVLLPLHQLLPVDSAPYFGLAETELKLLWWCSFGLISLPWAWRESRRMQVGWLPSSLFLALHITGFFFFLWRAVRPRDLHQPASAFITRRRKYLAPWPFTAPGPIGWMLLLVIILGPVQIALGGMRVMRYYSIRVEPRATEIYLNGERKAQGAHLGWALGAPAGRFFGSYNSYVSRYFPQKGEGLPANLAISDLAAALPQIAKEDYEFAPGPYVLKFLRENDLLDLRLGEYSGRIRSVKQHQELHNFQIQMSLEFEVEFPAMKEQADFFLREAMSGSLSKESRQAAAQAPSPFFGEVFRHYRRQQRQTESGLNGQALWEALLQVGQDRLQGLSWQQGADRVAQHFHQGMAGTRKGTWHVLRRRFTDVAPEILALAADLTGSEEAWDRLLLERPALALLIAGFSERRELFQDCSSTFRKALAEPVNSASREPILLVSAWAMAALVPGEASRLLFPEIQQNRWPFLAAILAAADDPESQAWLATVAQAPAPEKESTQSLRLRLAAEDAARQQPPMEFWFTGPPW
ncbi:MAG: hypothetical protein DWQ01_04495 [Planctomycetota bacterium]|nr:MAG: hypothetical protein DWQ01_04495 [Planctomycetota bacterium]